jgi:hypothetical protein
MSSGRKIKFFEGAGHSPRMSFDTQSARRQFHLFHNDFIQFVRHQTARNERRATLESAFTHRYLVVWYASHAKSSGPAISAKVILTQHIEMTGYQLMSLLTVAF